MALYNNIWWILFFIFGILVQRALPGFDFFIVGLIIALQERNPIQIISVIFVAIVIQEGCGSLAFGTSILWYTCVTISYFIGCWLFEAKNILFITLLSASIGLSRYYVTVLMLQLQNLPGSSQTIFSECIAQTLYTPFIWKALSLTRHWRTTYDDQS